ncbi:MAG: HD domain-containing protein [Oscillospiraceae bacterium]|nr:HD domain-containing protein [Oscillospiraceae bacterium]
MLAHVTEDRRREQTLNQHCRTVALLCAYAAHSLHLENTARLVGLLHDFGKATRSFQNYLEGGNEHPNHSAGFGVAGDEDGNLGIFLQNAVLS